MKTEEIMVATEKLRKTGVSTEQANKNFTNYSKVLNMSEEYKEEIKNIKKLLVEDNLTYSGQLRFLAYTVKLEEENQQLKERNEFLIKRENKLQQIEMMFKNRSVDLEELSNLILEGSNE